MNYDELTLIEYVKNIKEKKLTAVAGVKFFMDKIAKDKHNAVLQSFADALERADNIDKRLAKGEDLGKLAGAPIIIKDNILYKGHVASAGSKIIEKYIAPYSSTIVEKLIAEDAIIIGRANMDEFGMGSTGQNSAYGPTHNAHEMGYVAGGSSSGAAVAVASGLCIAAIGTDTGASVRTPASYNGLFSIKPTYGTVSRYGIIAYASSLDQAGPICKTAEDVELLWSVIRGKDFKDGTSLEFKNELDFKLDIKKINIGYVKEIWQNKSIIQDFDKYQKLFDWFKSQGAHVKEISIENLDIALPAYYIIADAEVASNLARFDGVKYTSAAKNCKSIEELYVKTRTQFLGAEAKRRIMLGNFVLSSGYFDAYYGKAKKVQSMLRQSFHNAFEECDVILMPITLSDALKIGEKTSDPVEMYLEDLFTVPANVTGVPAVAIPFEKGKKNLPIGFQILGKHFSEPMLFELAKFFEKGFIKGGTK